MPDRISLDELLEVANKVRAAGGGNPLDALMPAVPSDPHQCLIAKNMNFNCKVEAYGPTGWRMTLDDKDTRDKIAEALGWGTHEEVDEIYSDVFDEYETEICAYCVELPREIGAVAEEFDRIQWNAKRGNEYDGTSELIPYIEQSVREAYSIAQVNDKGEIIL